MKLTLRSYKQEKTKENKEVKTIQAQVYNNFDSGVRRGVLKATICH